MCIYGPYCFAGLGAVHGPSVVLCPLAKVGHGPYLYCFRNPCSLFVASLIERSRFASKMKANVRTHAELSRV